jgi:hypothetical protein
MTTRADLNGIAKRVFGKVSKAVPSWAELQKRMEFQSRAKIGAEYEELVYLRRPHGVTTARTTAGTVYNLNAVRVMKSEPARVAGCELVLRDQVPYGLAAAAQQSGAQAYEAAVAEVLLQLAESHRFYIEVGMLYGRSPDGIGRVESVSGSGTTRAWVITRASWAPGLWVQAEGAGLDAFINSGGTQRNTNAVVDVVSVDADNRTVNVSGNATDLSAVVAGDMIVFRTQDAEMFSGIDAIVRNTGTLFNISASTYGLWRGTTFDNGGNPLTLAAAHTAITRAAVKGGLGDMVCYLNTYSWQDLIDDQGALRRYADRTKQEYVQGAENIKFYGSNGGVIEFVPHPMVKGGEAFSLCMDDWIRGGESDLTQKTPGADNDDFFHEIPGQAGFEVRNFSSQFVMSRRPARQVRISNILPRGL